MDGFGCKPEVGRQQIYSDTDTYGRRTDQKVQSDKIGLIGCIWTDVCCARDHLGRERRIQKHENT